MKTNRIILAVALYLNDGNQWHDKSHPQESQHRMSFTLLTCPVPKERSFHSFYFQSMLSADNVPITAGGVASFDLASSGGSSPANNNNASQDKPDLMYVDSDMQIMDSHTHTRADMWWDEEETDYMGFTEDWTTSHYDHHWNNGIGGNVFTSDLDISHWTPDMFYGDNGYFPPGGTSTSAYQEHYNWSASGVLTVVGTDYGMPTHPIGQEHCAESDPGPDYSGSGWAVHGDGLSTWRYWQYSEQDETYTRTAQTKMKLHTGGKAIPARQNLFQITCPAVDIEGYGVEQGTDSKRAQPPFGYGLLSESPAIPPEKISVGGLGTLKSDGNLWTVLPDGADLPATPVVGGKRFYVFWPGEQKFHSSFEAFVCQPWPDLSYQPWLLDDDLPPLGWPIYSVADNGGHAWWKLTTDAPTDAVNQFAKAYASQWMNTEVGYGETSGLDWLYAILHFTSPTAPGVLPFTNTHTWTVHKTYAIGFPGLIAGLNHTEHVHEYPGTYDLRYHNCVIEVWITGGAAGVTLPHDWDPEDFGFDLPPDSP